MARRPFEEGNEDYSSELVLHESISFVEEHRRTMTLVDALLLLKHVCLTRVMHRVSMMVSKDPLRVLLRARRDSVTH
jgi:hypothetical protein